MKRRRVVCLLCVLILMMALCAPTFSLAADAADTHTLPAQEGIKGYFVFQNRGYEISVADAIEAAQDWGKSQFGEGSTASMLDSKGNPTAEVTLGTGQRIRIKSGEKNRIYGVLVRGDSLGTGKPGMTQLVRVAQAFGGQTDGLSDLQLEACDLDGSGSVSITDVTQCAMYNREPHEAGPVVPEEPVKLESKEDVLSAEQTRNIYRNNYYRWSSPMTSYLYENKAGNLVRVEWLAPSYASTQPGSVLIEEYEDREDGFALVDSRKIEAELPLFGGFFAAKDYNYLFFGQTNPEESDSKEVIRVVQYDKNWKRIAADGLKGANTTVPFDAGSLRCAEYKDMLYVRTSHEMYARPDGTHHQANLQLAVRQSTMKITDLFAEVANNMFGYVSHSFNQFILVDQKGRITTVDHGDGHPRAITLMRYLEPAGQDKFMTPGYNYKVEQGDLLPFPGVDGDNDTGASVGGFCELGGRYVVAFNYDGSGGAGGQRPAYLILLDEDAQGSSGQEMYLSKLSMTDSSTPMLVPTSANEAYVLWMQAQDGPDILAYNRANEDGSVVPEPTTSSVGALSDCQPINWNGKIVWYVTNNSAPVFYTLDATGVWASPVE